MSDILSSTQTLVGHSSDTHWSDLVEWSVEVDFLVAKEKPGQTYTAEADGRSRWACPASHPKPVEACVEHCAEHLAATLNLKPCVRGGVAYKNSNVAEDDIAFTIEKPANEEEGTDVDNRTCYWFFTPAPDTSTTPASATSASPSEYDWVGVRLRCPYSSFPSLHSSDRYGDQDLGRGTAREGMAPIAPFRGKIEMETVLGLLRTDIKMHTNSTCQMGVCMNLRPEGFDLIDAKKALSLVWLMEPDLLLALRPKTENPHYLPITKHSGFASRPSCFYREDYASLTPEELEWRLTQSRPLVPQDAEDMYRYIPRLKNPLIQERIQMIWDPTTMEELSDALKYAGGAALDIAPDRQPTLTFRYGLWHPQREAMQYWVHLFGRLFLFAVASDAKRFRTAVASIEDKVAEVAEMDKKDRLKAMLTHSFDHSLSHYWIMLKAAEQSGGCLSPEALDRQGILAAGPSQTLAVGSDGSNSSSSGEGLWLRR